MGGGHQSAAQALKEIILSDSPRSLIKIVDMSPPLGSPIYRFLSNYLTEVFVKNWHAFNNESNAQLLHLLSTPLALAKLTPVLTRFRPELIIATHAFSTEEVGAALKQLRLKIPLVVVVVDPFSVHHAWTTYKQADLYLLPNHYCLTLFKKRGFNPRRLVVTGQPIRAIPKDLKPIKFTPKKLTVLLGGSGEGVGRIDQVVKQLIKKTQILNRLRLIVACGKNRGLLKEMQKLKPLYPELIQPYGFTDKIYQLIKSSDLVVGKAGPNLMWETIALGKPLLTTGHPLGQEAGNYRFISRAKLGGVTYSPQQTVKQLVRVVNRPRLLLKWRAGIKREQQRIKQTPRRCLGALRPFLH